MGNLSEHFSQWEFECKCGCGLYIPNPELIIVLERIHDFFDNKVIDVSSGTRCPYWNAHEGGEEKSRHLTGEAADIHVRGISQTFVTFQLDIWYPESHGIGTYYTFTHIDVRKKRARW